MHTLVAVMYLCKSIASARTPPAHPGYKMGSPKVHGIVRTLITMTFDRLFHSINSIPCKGSRLRPFFVRVHDLTIHQHVSCPTRGPNTLDHCYTQFKNAYKARSLPAFGKSDHAAIFPTPEYKQRLVQEPPVEREVTRWSSHSEAMLQTAFYDVDWDMFRRVLLTSASSRM